MNKEALVFSGGGLKAACAPGVAKALQEAVLPDGKRYLDRFGLYAGGSGGSISALALAAQQADKLVAELSRANQADFMNLKGLIPGRDEAVFDMAGVIDTYSGWGFDEDRVLNGPDGLLIPVTDYKTGEIIWCTNKAIADAGDFTFGDRFDLWDTVYRTQALPMMTQFDKKDGPMKDLYGEKIGDSANHSGLPLMVVESIRRGATDVLTVDMTKKGSRELDLAFASWYLGLNVNEGRYAEWRQLRDVLANEIAQTGALEIDGERVEVREIPIEEPLPPSNLLQGLIRSEVSLDPFMDHGCNAARKWLKTALAGL